MRLPLIGLTGLVALSLTACGPVTQNEPVGAIAGAGVGFITAKALDVDPKWELAAALAGAAAGALVARNTATRECAYSYGDGTYYTAPCP